MRRPRREASSAGRRKVRSHLAALDPLIADLDSDPPAAMCTLSNNLLP